MLFLNESCVWGKYLLASVKYSIYAILSNSEPNMQFSMQYGRIVNGVTHSSFLYITI